MDLLFDLSIVSTRILNISVIAMVHSQCYSLKAAKKYYFPSIIKIMISDATINIYITSQYSLSIYYVLSLFIFSMIVFDIFRFFGKHQCFGSNGNKISQFSLSIFVPEKKHQISQKINKNNGFIRNSYIYSFSLRIFITLSIVLNYGNLINPNEPKQQIVINCIMAKVQSFIPRQYHNNKIWSVCRGCESEIMAQGRSYIDENIDVSQCFFLRSSILTGNGGVIYVSGGPYSMKVEYSMFYNCSCDNQGGAIHFSATESYLKMICANRCSASSFYHFAYIVSQVNQVEYLSVSECSFTAFKDYSYCLKNGNQRVESANISMNNAAVCSGILINTPSSFTSNYCAFSNNIVSSNMCIRIYSTSGTITMSYANVVHNNSPSLGVICVNGAGSRKMMNCIFQNNYNYLFSVREGSLEVTHSFIDHPSSLFFTSTSVITANNSLTNTMTYQIQFFNSHYCNADIPLIEPKRIITIDQIYMKSYSFLYPGIILMIL